jgi:biuret amidohydrolase
MVDGEVGNDFIDELQPLQSEIVIKKPGKGAFYNTQLNSILKKLKITNLIFTGVTTEVCVQTSMREANDRVITIFFLFL